MPLDTGVVAEFELIVTLLPLPSARIIPREPLLLGMGDEPTVKPVTVIAAGKLRDPDS